MRRDWDALTEAINQIRVMERKVERAIRSSDFDKLNKSNVGLGLKNISSRLRVVQGNINFEKDISQTYYKVTIEMPTDETYN